jgi:hypothetical protein
MEFELQTKTNLNLNKIELVFNPDYKLTHLSGNNDKEYFVNIPFIPDTIGYHHGNSISLTIDIETGKIQGWNKFIEQLPELCQNIYNERYSKHKNTN